MEETSEQNDAISKRTSKKWLLPILWLFLVTWYIKRSSLHSIPRPSSAAPEQAADDGINSTIKSFNEATLISQPYGTIVNTTYAPANITTSNKVAVIIETRSASSFIPLILHFANVLGPTWPVVIYTPAENFGSFTTSSALNRYIRIGRVVLKPLAEGVWFPNWDSVSQFLTQAWLWEDLAPAEHILLFQTDSILCSNSVRSVDDFFEWDLIGAPIVPFYGAGYNGGLSLRKRSVILRVLSEWTWSGNGPEDQWFYARLRDLESSLLEQGIEGVVKLPSMEIARTFAVETIDYPNPLGLHQPTRFISADGRMIPLDDWCPEYKLAITERINE